ncbi:hypothetical protein [Actinomadura violacea]|uniref:Uncharacterized protein n=1 Tax=Actinomadura violacea TaxID=2819934 RepID=A0ABS3RV17_9ACTN|nr:hypothetical protein [Actinomadura violacea]MBO2460612.1 hypothetical protein [Actinomadura violacea]
MMMNQLFEERPKQWGLRGDPYVWDVLQERLRGTPVPTEAGEVEGLLLDAFRAVVGVDLRTAQEESVYREEFAHGGMSSGSVHLPTWRERLVPLLVQRARG